MPVQSGIWQEWQAGQALRAARKGRLFPSCSCRVEPRRFFPRWNAGKSRADRMVCTDRWIERGADRWQSGGLRKHHHGV